MPMPDPNLVRFLSHQTRTPLGHVSHLDLFRGEEAAREGGGGGEVGGGRAGSFGRHSDWAFGLGSFGEIRGESASIGDGDAHNRRRRRRRFGRGRRLGRGVRALHDRIGLTSLMVTHDMAEALLLADRVLVMDHGRIVADETPAALVAGAGGEEAQQLVAVPRAQAQALAGLERGDG